MRNYPRFKYHPSKDAQVVQSLDDEKKLGSDWYDSPAEYGVESCPGLVPDPLIAGKKLEPESPKKKGK